MNYKTIANAVTSRMGRQVLTIQKHSPTILFGAGVVGVVATAVLAARSTLKLDAVVDEAQHDLHMIKAVEEGKEDYTDNDRKKDVALVYAKTAGKITKLYTPAVVVGTLSIAALSGSHIILTRRNVAITAAYAAVEKGFREYRQRVIDDLGEDKDKEYRYGLVDREIIEETPEGPKPTTIKVVGSKDRSIYARFFDETCSSWQKTPSYNQFFIQCQQNYANDLLKARGHVFLNEVYDMLGMERSKEGSVVGWVLGNGDNYIDFGVFTGDRFMGQQFINGSERSILLDFNVDGLMYNKI